MNSILGKVFGKTTAKEPEKAKDYFTPDTKLSTEQNGLITAMLGEALTAKAVMGEDKEIRYELSDSKNRLQKLLFRFGKEYSNEFDTYRSNLGGTERGSFKRDQLKDKWTKRKSDYWEEILTGNELYQIEAEVNKHYF